MCGIAGVWSATQPLPEISSGPVARSLKHRGPDEFREWSYPKAWLGYSRLAITGSKYSLGQIAESERGIVLFNGEIVNFKNLVARYFPERMGSPLGESDTRLVIDLIGKLGFFRAVDTFRGMWAIAYYDKGDQSLCLSRDPLGIKPLFFSRRRPGQLVFASTPKVVGLLTGEKPTLSLSGATNLLTIGGLGEADSLMLGVEQFPPGSSRVIPGGGLSSFDWVDGTVEPLKKIAISEVVSSSSQTLNAVLEETIADYFDGENEIALLLSGGIDSSFLARVCAKVGRKNVIAYHLNTGEEEFAASVANYYGIPLRPVEMNISDFTAEASLLPRLTGAAFASSPIPGVVASAVAKDGLRVAMSANGADELFFGYARTPFIGDQGLGVPGKHHHFSTINQLKHIFREADITWRGRHISSEFMLQQFIQKHSWLWRQPPRRLSILLELLTYVRRDLNPALDHSFMTHGVEARVPFLDQRIVEAALVARTGDIVDENLGFKAILKRPLEEDLGRAFVLRPKEGFSVPSRVMPGIRKSAKRAVRRLGLGIHPYPRARNAYRDEIYVGNAAIALDQFLGSIGQSGR